MVPFDFLTSCFNRSFRRVLAALLAIDVALILAHLAIVLTWGKDSFPPALLTFDINSDNTLGEIVGYLKLAALVLGALWLWLRTRSPVFPAVGLFFLLILLDDAGQLHERLGGRIAGRFLTGFGGAAHDLGEIVVWAVLAIPALGALGWGAWRSAPRFRLAAAVIVVPTLAALAFTGVFLDLVSAVIGRLPEGPARMPLRIVFGILEDGGEMMALSLGCALAAGVAAAITGARRWDPAVATA